jgi:hypothetical protein
MFIEELDEKALADQSAGAIEAEKQCKIYLAADWPRPIKLEWHGGKGHRLSVIVLEPGKSVTQPLAKAQAWFGPFSAHMQYAATSDERQREKIKLFWQQEKTRYLSRYDYPRPISMTKGGYEPIGPHRSPDVTVTIIENDGFENPPIRLYEMYQIGPWDPIKDQFTRTESAAETEARLNAELEAAADKHQAELQQLRREIASLAGMVQVLTGAAGKAK